MATLRDDVEVRRDVSDAIDSDLRIDATRVSVDVLHNVVTLRGTVSTPYEQRLVDDLARRVKGVRDVMNELRVAPKSPGSDDQIAADVRAVLAADAWTDDRSVAVRVNHGVVYLSGAVEGHEAKCRAEADAWSVPGVVNVVDNVEITPNPNRTDAEISQEVRRDLEKNLRLEPDAISLEATRGTVYLRGNVRSIEQKWLAEEIAWWTTGVRDVVNALKVLPPPTTGENP